MHRFRSILLSGLVALLMVGMVSAGEVQTQAPEYGVDAPIQIHLGSWVGGVCINDGGSKCLSLGIDLDITWLINLFQ